MSLWHRFNLRSAAARRAQARVDECLSLLGGARGRGPDQTELILARVGSVIPLVGVPQRRCLTAGRVVVGVALAACVGVGALALGAWRDAASMSGVLGASAPVSRVLASAVDDVTSAVRNVAAASQGVASIGPGALLALVSDAGRAPVQTVNPPTREVISMASRMLAGEPIATACVSRPSAPSGSDQIVTGLPSLDGLLNARRAPDLAHTVAWQVARGGGSPPVAADLALPR